MFSHYVALKVIFNLVYSTSVPFTITFFFIFDVEFVHCVSVKHPSADALLRLATNKNYSSPLDIYIRYLKFTISTPRIHQVVKTTLSRYGYFKLHNFLNISRPENAIPTATWRTPKLATQAAELTLTYAVCYYIAHSLREHYKFGYHHHFNSVICDYCIFHPLMKTPANVY